MRPGLFALLLLTVVLAGCNLPDERPGASEAAHIPTSAGTGQEASNLSGAVITPQDLHYLGAIRLPEGRARPLTFEYGGNAMTYDPSGDPDGAADGFPGSLFISGHDRLPYGELPDGSQVAEVDLPAPIASHDLEALNRAEFLQDFQDVTAGHFTDMEEIVRTGLLYLDNPATGAVIHIAWGQHLEPDPASATHGWFNADLSDPDFQGAWFIQDQSWYGLNDYLFEIPAGWAEATAHGRLVATGRFKDGGWSGMGPDLIAYRPWDEQGAPYPAGARIPSTTLLEYASSLETDRIENSLASYQHPDEWSGGAWLTTGDGRSGVLFAGAKSNGTKYWYGYINPHGPQFPCVDEQVTDFLTCRMADGSTCPDEDFQGCSGHNEYRGWWSTRWDAQFLLYDPADLARVAGGQLDPWEPQPYATLDIDETLFFNPAGVETGMLGTGDQRRYRLGDVAYDRTSGLLYILELYADGAAPIVHVWQLR